MPERGGQFRYCFGSTQTTWGALRAADGHLASDSKPLYVFLDGSLREMDMSLT